MFHLKKKESQWMSAFELFVYLSLHMYVSKSIYYANHRDATAYYDLTGGAASAVR